MGEASGKKTKRRRRRTAATILTVFIIVVCIGAVILLTKFFGSTLLFGKDELYGLWQLDEVTSYEFDGDGEGALVLPTASYSFRYDIDGELVSIDFEDESANDAVYSYTIESDVLTLTAGQADDEIIYRLEKIER